MTSFKEINNSLKFEHVKNVKFTVSYDGLDSSEILRIDFSYMGHKMHGRFATDGLQKTDIIYYVRYVKCYIRCLEKTKESAYGDINFLYAMLDKVGMEDFFKRAGQTGTYSPQRVVQDMATMQILQ